MKNLLTQKVDVALCDKLLKLADEMLAKVNLMPAESREAWNREIVASKQRIEETKTLFTETPARDTTHKDRTVVLMHLTLAQQFANLLREEGERRHEAGS